MPLESDCCSQFAANYDCSGLPAVRAFEREVLGCDYGGTSWTTREQAVQAARSLGLCPDSALLEIGCGSGWPGLYLSTVTGCGATLIDLPFNALQQAAERARSDEIDGRVDLICGSGEALPFAGRSFNRISHSDVLCCLPGKREMLEECRRVSTDDALMHFAVIEPAAGISASDRHDVIVTGPPFIDVSPTYERLLEETGWKLMERSDVSAAYSDSLAKLADGLAEQPELQQAYGIEAAREACQHRRDQLALVESGTMLRFIYLVRAR